MRWSGTAQAGSRRSALRLRAPSAGESWRTAIPWRILVLGLPRPPGSTTHRPVARRVVLRALGGWAALHVVGCAASEAPPPHAPSARASASSPPQPPPPAAEPSAPEEAQPTAVPAREHALRLPPRADAA